MIVNEADGEDPQANKWLSIIDGMRIFNRSQLVGFLTEAGFSNVIVDQDAKGTGSVRGQSGRIRGQIHNREVPYEKRRRAGGFL